MSSRHRILVALTLGLAAGVAAIRLMGDYDWATWLIGLASVSGVLLAATGPGLTSRPYLGLSGFDIPVLLTAAAALALVIWAADPTSAVVMMVISVWKIGWEELWFRGLWLEGTGNIFWPAICGSAVFCAMHLPPTPDRALTLLLLSGLYYALRAGGVSIVALIMLHAAVNTASSSGAHTAVILATLGGLTLITFAGRKAASGLGWKNA